jgi:hypothetical protein
LCLTSFEGISSSNLTLVIEGLPGLGGNRLHSVVYVAKAWISNGAY